jgi:hypothetical protein
MTAEPSHLWRSKTEGLIVWKNEKMWQFVWQTYLVTLWVKRNIRCKCCLIITQVNCYQGETSILVIGGTWFSMFTSTWIINLSERSFQEWFDMTFMVCLCMDKVDETLQSVEAPCVCTVTVDTWLILPVVICLSQRLSHACLSINLYTVKLRMAH